MNEESGRRLLELKQAFVRILAASALANWPEFGRRARVMLTIVHSVSFRAPSLPRIMFVPGNGPVAKEIALKNNPRN